MDHRVQKDFICLFDNYFHIITSLQLGCSLVPTIEIVLIELRIRIYLLGRIPFVAIFPVQLFLSFPNSMAVSKSVPFFPEFPFYPIGVDKDSGLVHTVEATAANVHDVAEVPKLLTGEEEAVYGDSGYLGAGKREDAVVRNKSGRKIKYKINRRPSQMKKLSKSGQYAAKRAEHAKSSVRAKVEHVFGVVKKQLRFRGLEKQQAKFNIMFALANLILADRPCLAA